MQVRPNEVRSTSSLRGEPKRKVLKLVAIFTKTVLLECISSCFLLFHFKSTFKNHMCIVQLILIVIITVILSYLNIYIAALRLTVGLLTIQKCFQRVSPGKKQTS